MSTRKEMKDARDNAEAEHFKKMAAAKRLFGLKRYYRGRDVKKKAKSLKQKYHPDKGGKIFMFHRVCEAEELLLKSRHYPHF